MLSLRSDERCLAGQSPATAVGVRGAAWCLALHGRKATPNGISSGSKAQAVFGPSRGHERTGPHDPMFFEPDADSPQTRDLGSLEAETTEAMGGAESGPLPASRKWQRWHIFLAEDDPYVATAGVDVS